MNQPVNNCSMCERVNAILRAGENPFLIHEFEHSVFVVGEHQFFRGYCLLLFKEHARELHELETNVQAALFAELMIAGCAVADTFKPWKMNYSCYGNAVPHIHWHLFPRYESDADRAQTPWFHASRFDGHLIDAKAARNLAAQIRAKLILPPS